jgi:tetratricopeptide (TPR) repeat protein
MMRWAIWSLLVLYPSLAAGAERPSGIRHRQHKQAAYAAFELGKYSEAIEQFEQAYRLKRDPRLLYNIGLAYFRRFELFARIADLHQARHLFRRFLLLVPLPARGRDREPIRQARRYSSSYLKRIEVTLARQRAGHQPSATRPVPPQSQPARRSASLLRANDDQVLSRDEAERVASTAGSGSAELASPGDRPDAEPPDSGDRSGYAHWLLYGLAGSLAVAAGVTGGLALAADQRSDTLAADADLAAADEANRSDRLALATDILIGSAVISAAAAVVLHLLDWRNQGAAPTVATPVGLRATF